MNAGRAFAFPCEKRVEVEQFHEARLVRITRGGFAIWLDPFGMLDPQVVVNLQAKLGVRVNLVRCDACSGEIFECGVGRLQSAFPESSAVLGSAIGGTLTARRR